MANKEIREKARIRDVKMWEIAGKLGITDGSLCRKLRFEVSEDLKNRILSIIDDIADNRTAEE